jgi:hypothetical protein
VWRLRQDERFKRSHYVFIVENSLSRVVAANLHRYVMNYQPLTALHDDKGGKENYVPTTNETKLLGWGLLARFLNERRIHFAKDFVTTNETQKDAKNCLKEDLENMIIRREEKVDKSTVIQISGKPKTDDTVMALIIGLSHWARWTRTAQYHSGTIYTMAYMGESARLKSRWN